MRSDARSGQAMLIAILTIGGAILGATALAGFLTLYEIRATTDSENSAKAIFAADTGLSWVLYTRLNGATDPLPGTPTEPLGDGATTFVACYDVNNALVPGGSAGCSNASATTAFSRGTSLDSLRAFTLGLADATVTVP